MGRKKRRTNANQASFRCLKCHQAEKETLASRKLFDGKVYLEEKDFVCKGLRQHINAKGNKKCFDHYDEEGLVKFKRNGDQVIDISTSVFDPMHQLGIGLRQRAASGTTFNQSINNQTIYQHEIGKETSSATK